MNNLNQVSKNKKLIYNSLNKTKQEYRPYDPGWYLYRNLLKYKIREKFKEKFIELAYVTLSSWNMNSRGAKLSDFEIFSRSIKDNKKEILKLSKYRIEKVSRKCFDEVVIPKLKILFFNLKLVGNNKNGKEKPRLVTFSKTLHYYLPDLIVPIDRKYTLNLFYGHTGINNKVNHQFSKFKDVFEQFYEFSKHLENMDLKVDDKWNSNLPKMLDNMIIGHEKLKK